MPLPLPPPEIRSLLWFSSARASARSCSLALPRSLLCLRLALSRTLPSRPLPRSLLLFLPRGLLATTPAPPGSAGARFGDSASDTRSFTLTLETAAPSVLTSVWFEASNAILVTLDCVRFSSWASSALIALAQVKGGTRVSELCRGQEQ